MYLPVLRFLPPHHLRRVALYEALVWDLLVSEGHGSIAPVIARNAQPPLDLTIVIDRPF